MIQHTKRVTLTVLLAAICCNLAPGQAPPLHDAGWIPINAGIPNSFFGITALTIDPSTPSTLYAITPQGGLFKSTDAAATWKAVSGLSNLSSLAIDPNNSSTIYATTQNGVAKSIDAGDSWNTANGNLTDNCYLLAIDPIAPMTVYGLSNGGIFKTDDGGATWKQIHVAIASSLVIDPITPSTLYASLNNGGILKSTDSGESWATIKGGIPFAFFYTSGALIVDPQTPSNLYAGSFVASSVTTAPGVPPIDVGTGSISKSIDGGQTWMTVRTGIPSDAFVDSLTLNPASPSTIYAGYTNFGAGGILKSTDGGQSWSVINTVEMYGSSRAIAAVDPRSPSIVYVAYSAFYGIGTMSKSADGGSSWQPSNEGLAYYDLHVLAIDPFSPATVYTGGAGGVFKSDDAGGNWINLASFHVSSGYPIGAGLSGVRSLLINFNNPNTLYVETVPINGCASDEKAVFKSTDGGATWSDSISPPDSGCMLGALGYSSLMAMGPTDPDTLYLSEPDDEDGIHALLESTDGGVTWSNIWSGLWNDADGLHYDVNTLAIDPAAPTTLYAGLATGVFKSIDGGARWNLTSLKDTFVTVLTIDRTNPRIVFAGGFSGLFKTTDAGENWVASGLDSITSIVIAPNDSNVVYAGTSGDGIYKSVNGGRNWVRFDNGLTNLNIRALAIAPGTAMTLYAATSGGVFRTIDEVARISASPNPCVLSGSVCTSYLTWNTTGLSDVQAWVRIGDGPESPFASGSSCSNTDCAAPWIQGGGLVYTFTLYDCSSVTCTETDHENAPVLGSVRVTAQ